MTSQTSPQGAAAQPAVSPMPAGYSSLTPFVVVDGAEQAIAFYQAVLGARVVSRNDTPDGRIAHCELELANGRMQLSDPMPDHNLVAPAGGDVVSGSVVAYLPDVDAAYAKAVELGAKGYGDPCRTSYTRPIGQPKRTLGTWRTGRGGHVAMPGSPTTPKKSGSE